MKAKADALIEQLYNHSGQSMDATKWANLFSFDVMGEIGFSKDFHSIRSGQEHPASKAVHDHLAILGVMQTVPWLLNLLSIIPGAAAGFSEFFSVCEQEMAEKERVRIAIMQLFSPRPQIDSSNRPGTARKYPRMLLRGF